MVIAQAGALPAATKASDAKRRPQQPQRAATGRRMNGGDGRGHGDEGLRRRCWDQPSA